MKYECKVCGALNPKNISCKECNQPLNKTKYYEALKPRTNK
jgi:hypothetical protein